MLLMAAQYNSCKIPLYLDKKKKKILIKMAKAECIQILFPITSGNSKGRT